MEVAVLALASCLAGCGGGDGSDSGSTNTQGAGTSYAFVDPVLNATRAYNEQIVDNSNNTIDISFNITATEVNSDGSFSIDQEPTGSSAIVNGTNYTVSPEQISYDSSGRGLQYDVTTAAGVPETCKYEPYAAGPQSPVQVGQTWATNYTEACGSSTPTSYAQSGSVTDVEMVTVPAGTFTAIKLQSTITWTDSQGTTRTETVTNWRDTKTSYSIKQQITIAYSGTLPTTGYAVSRLLELQSIS